MAELANQEERILLGHISGLFGVKGWVKVFSYTSPRTQITEYKQWYLGQDNEQFIQLEAGQAHKIGVIAKLAGIDDRDLAVTLIKKEIWVNRRELPVLSAGEYYWHQLIGCEVIDTSGQTIGKVHDLIETGANDVFIVRALDKDKKTKEHLIPYLVGQVVQSIDLDKQQIQVEWDLDY